MCWSAGGYCFNRIMNFIPTIVRKDICFATPYLAHACGFAAAFCMMVFLCAAPLAGAEPETAQAEDVHAEMAQEEGQESDGPDEQDATPIRIPKKKVAIAQFDVANTLHVDDINNIYDGLPMLLASRLEASGEFLPTYTGRSVPREMGASQREAIIQIAGETGAQFLISGLVVNAASSKEKGILGTSFREKKKRYIEIELAVYDGLTGARLLLRRLNEQAQGDVMVGNNKPFGSSIFFETESGKALSRVMDVAVGDIRTALENEPFSAHIIRIEGKRVVLDAGSDSLLVPGDKLVAYVRQTKNPIAGIKGSVLGVTDRAVDMITLAQVKPQYSIGELPDDAAKLGIKVGSIARIDPDEQRNLTEMQIAVQQMAEVQQKIKEEEERARIEQAARVEAARIAAEQAAKAEAARVAAEKKAQAQAAAEAKAAKLKAIQEAKAAKKAINLNNARAVAEAREAKLKAQREAKAEAARVKAEKKAQTAAETKAAKPKVQQEPKAGADAAAKPSRIKTVRNPPPRMEVRAVAEEDLQRAAEAGRTAASQAGAPPAAQAATETGMQPVEAARVEPQQAATEATHAKTEPSF